MTKRDVDFSIDPNLVKDTGAVIVDCANGNLKDIPILGKQISDQLYYMPATVTTALTQFSSNFTKAYTDMLHQRVGIGKALESASVNASLNEMLLSNSFHANQQGAFPLPPASFAPAPSLHYPTYTYYPPIPVMPGPSPVTPPPDSHPTPDPTP